MVENRTYLLNQKDVIVINNINGYIEKNIVNIFI